MRKKASTHKKTINDLRHLPSGEEDVIGRIAFWDLDSFRRLGQAARTLKKLEEYIRGRWPNADKSDVYPCGADNIWVYFWHILYPEKFHIIETRTEDNRWRIRYELTESFTPRDKEVVQTLLKTSHGRVLLWRTSIRNAEPDWASQSKSFRSIDPSAFSTLKPWEPLSCARCGEVFVPGRQGMKYCSKECRKAVHDVPPEKRTHYHRVYTFFRRQLKKGDKKLAWELTREKHGDILEELEMDGPTPPSRWHAHIRDRERNA